MKTKALYYDNIYLYETNTKVIETLLIDNKYHCILEETIFYPSGGGMNHDLGYINDLEVLDVYKKDDEIYHVIDSNISGEVSLKIDKTNRIKSCQIHSTQHLLSAIIEKNFNTMTLSHHVFENYASLDLDKELSKIQLEQLNTLTFDAIYNNYDITTLLLSKSDLAKYNIKDNDKYVEPIRIVNIEYLNDYNPCGCLHIENLYQIGQVVIFKQEKISRGYRLYFSAGLMLDDYFKKDYLLLNSIYKTTKSNKDNLILNIDNLMNKNQSLNNELNLIKNSYFFNYLDNSNNKLITFNNELFDFKDYQVISKEVINYPKDVIVYFYNKLNEEYQFIISISKTSNIDINSLYEYLILNCQIKGGKSKFNITGKSSINIENILSDYILEFCM